MEYFVLIGYDTSMGYGQPAIFYNSNERDVRMWYKLGGEGYSKAFYGEGADVEIGRWHNLFVSSYKDNEDGKVWRRQNSSYLI